MRPHCRQFIICDKIISPNDSFKNIKINNTYYLCYDKSLNFIKKDRIIILGNIYCINEINDINYYIESINSNQINIEYFLSVMTGRYVIIYDNKIYQDCLSQLNLYYNIEYNIVSSSLGLIRYYNDNICDLNYGYYNSYKQKFPFDFYLSPNSVYKEFKINKVHDIIQIEDNVEIINRDLNLNKYMDFDYEYCYNKVIKYIKNSIKNIYMNNEEIILSLSDGYDSRVLLSIISNIEGIKYKTFTTSKHNDICNHKLILVSMLSDVVNIENIQLISNNKEDNYEDIITEHCGYFHNDNEEFQILINNDYEILKNKTLIIGTIFEVFTKIANSDFKNIDRDNLYDSIISEFEINETCFDSLYFWIKEHNENHDISMDFEIIQRVGVFHSNILQLHDIYDYNRIPIINNIEILSLLNSMVKNIEFSREFEIDIIKRNNEKLLDFNFNIDNIHDIIKR